MENENNIETVQKSVRIPKDLYERLMKDAKKEERDFTKQLNYTVRHYYEILNTLRN